MTDLTLFTAPKPFTNPHIAMIQRNAILSWKQLGATGTGSSTTGNPDPNRATAGYPSGRVEVVLIGEEEGLAAAAAELGVTHLPHVRCNSLGTDRKSVV
jgi:hypothetical protein